MNGKYKPAKDAIMEALEKIPKTKGTTAMEYKAALEEIQDEVDTWFGASLDAAEDDIRREMEPR